MFYFDFVFGNKSDIKLKYHDNFCHGEGDWMILGDIKVCAGLHLQRGQHQQIDSALRSPRCGIVPGSF